MSRLRRKLPAYQTSLLGAALACGATLMSGVFLPACGSKTSPADANADAGSEDRDLPDLGPVHSSCPTDLAGPALVRVGWNGGVAFCIDSTEVTNANYQAFLAAASPPTQATRCQWNASFAPQTTGPGCPTFDPVGRANYPVVCVNWCDADAYCRSVGKYLCRAGSLDGNNPGPVTNPIASDGSQWVIACTNDGKLTYPYGSQGVPGMCVDKKFLAQTAGVQPVMSAPACVGGVAGVYDMSGNVSEWQDDCVEAATSEDGKDDECDTYGGAQSSDYADTSCAAAASTTDTIAHFTRAQIASDNGVRCCADAVFF
jgi:sulfatase modifying factor 1